jgi:hypothetical protein
VELEALLALQAQVNSSPLMPLQVPQDRAHLILHQALECLLIRPFRQV